jgi:superfamily II DNA or RNA helicase
MRPQAYVTNKSEGRSMLTQDSTTMDPIHLAQEIGTRFFRYLQSTFYFKDPEFRRSFEDALRAGSLVKGPYLELTPVYRRGKTAGDLMLELLGARFDSSFVAAMDPKRSLYSHQEQAIRRVEQGHNVVVATGTGSGKTESYLYPILLHLYRESLRTGPRRGVKALVLYPMNALANDQRRRLREYCNRLRDNDSSFSLTFGQYTGETPEDQNDRNRYARQHLDNRLAGCELVLRSEMRDEPPDILLTNYSMLEYLLLRPKDSELFDNGRGASWTFLVLDEAHQYRGSKGMEMAMLLRRLKQRLREGGLTHPLRCIATSASLGQGQQDRAGVARFAEKLFGEPFSEADVILEEREDIADSGVARLPPSAYALFSSPLDTDLARFAAHLDVPLEPGQSSAELAYRVLQADARVAQLREAIREPRKTDEIAAEVFGDVPEDRRADSLAAFVTLLTKTNDRTSSAPLLSARYHFFLRSLEGAFVSYEPVKRVRFERSSVTDANVSDAPAWFEVALCRECGQHYFVGRRANGKLQEAMRDQGVDEFNVSFFRPVEEEATPNGDAGSTDELRSALCLICGALSASGKDRSEPACSHGRFIEVVEEELREEHQDQMRTCGACRYQGPDPVREVVHGTDGPNAVVATTLHRSLPVGRKKILAFADGRQEAAFFAWYVQDSYNALRDRNVVLRSARSLAESGAVSLKTLARRVREEMRTQGIIGESTDDLDALHGAWVAVYREFVTDEPRLSLQGVGLVRWYPQLPGNLEMPECLLQPPWSLDETEARDLLMLLLDSMRDQFAVELQADSGVSLQWEDLRVTHSQASVEIGSRDGGKGIKGKKNIEAWDGVKGRRVRFLERLLIRCSPNGSGDETSRRTEAQGVLRKTWEALKAARSPMNRDDTLLLRAGDAMRLNPDWWRVQTLTNSSTLFRCETCGRHQTLSVRAVCPRPRCSGTLFVVSQDDQRLTANHYRGIYLEEMPPHLRAEEHTAQIDKEKAREFQAAFESGDIHLLSSSTTFELGVDLGDLDTIFLRNVPPEPFNYAQRVGRAGRRPGHAGFAVTYCRRRPHDIAHFLDPSRMLGGKTKPPVLRVTNEKIVLRHVAAVALSEFFRANRDRFKDVDTFCGDLISPHGARDFGEFLRTHLDGIEEALRAVVPSEMTSQVGLADGSWIDRISGPQSRLGVAESEVSSDYIQVSNLNRLCLEAREGREADRFKERAATIAHETVLDFLSRKAVIPKYGFPVDVVELDLQRAGSGAARASSEVSLQRDLAMAVSEFAPGSKIVANKKLWTSYGLKTVVGRQWDRRRYVRCSRHATFVSWAEGANAQQLPCGCEAPPSEYIDPIFGFITDGKTPPDPSSRSTKLFSTRPYFSRSAVERPEAVNMGGVATLTKASPGYLVVLCEGRKGQGFHICRVCGAGFATKPKSKTHKSPYRRDCSGQLDRVALGHEFLTDVVKMQFHGPSPLRGADGGTWFAYSLAYALLEGSAEVLEVPSTDLSVTVKQSETGAGISQIILYDNVPGGAGLVARLEEGGVFRQCLEEAQRRVAGICGCDENTSCDGCLRSYTNQFAHARLARGPVAQYLDEALLRWA